MTTLILLILSIDVDGVLKEWDGTGWMGWVMLVGCNWIELRWNRVELDESGWERIGAGSGIFSIDLYGMGADEMGWE